MTDKTSVIKLGNDTTASIKIKRTKRKHTIGISVKDINLIVVSSPNHISDEVIFNILKEKERWIRNKLEYIKKKQSNNKLFKQGEIHPYLGKDYTLQLVKSDNALVEIFDCNLIVSCINTDNELLVRHLLYNWYYNQARKIISERAFIIFSEFNQYSLSVPEISICSMKNKWGQCSARGIIKINKDLIKYDPKCIDYVIIHEFCHLIELNHSKKFYNLLDRHYPAWKSVRSILKAKGH